MFLIYCFSSLFNAHRYIMGTPNTSSVSTIIIRRKNPGCIVISIQIGMRGSTNEVRRQGNITLYMYDFMPKSNNFLTTSIHMPIFIAVSTKLTINTLLGSYPSFKNTHETGRIEQMTNALTSWNVFCCPVACTIWVNG